MLSLSKLFLCLPKSISFPWDIFVRFSSTAFQSWYLYKPNSQPLIFSFPVLTWVICKIKGLTSHMSFIFYRKVSDKLLYYRKQFLVYVGCSEHNAPLLFSQSKLILKAWKLYKMCLGVLATCSIFLCNLHPRHWPYATWKQGHVCTNGTSLFMPHKGTSLPHNSPCHHLQTLYHRWHLLGLWRDESLKEQVLGYMVDGAAQPTEVSWSLKACVRTCIVVVKQDSYYISVRLKSLKTLLELFQCVDINIWVYSLSFGHHILQSSKTLWTWSYQPTQTP